MTNVTASETSTIAARWRIWSARSSSVKRWLKTAISWKANSVWMPGSTMRHSSSSVCAASESFSCWRSSPARRAAIAASVGGARATAHCARRLPPERIVRAEQLRHFVAPLELVLNAPAPEGAHRLAARGIVGELDHLRGEVLGIVAARVERGVLRGEAPLGEVELHDRLAERHVLHDLVHGRLVVHVVRDVGIHADVRGVEHREELGIRDAPRERHVIADAQAAREQLHLIERGASAHEPEMDIAAAVRVHDALHGAQQQVDAFLAPHDAHVADEVLAPALERRVGRHDAQPLEARPAAHHGHLAGIHAAALDRVALRAVRLQRQVVAIDRDAVDLLVRLLAALPRRADDGDEVARACERRRLLPDAPVEGAGEVLDEEEDLSHQQSPSYTPSTLLSLVILTRSTICCFSPSRLGMSRNSGEPLPITIVPACCSTSSIELTMSFEMCGMWLRMYSRLAPWMDATRTLVS